MEGAGVRPENAPASTVRVPRDSTGSTRTILQRLLFAAVRPFLNFDRASKDEWILDHQPLILDQLQPRRRSRRARLVADQALPLLVIDNHMAGAQLVGKLKGASSQ